MPSLSLSVSPPRVREQTHTYMQVVIRQGEAADSMFFIVSGSLECSLRSQPLERLSRGQCLGEVIRTYVCTCSYSSSSTYIVYVCMYVCVCVCVCVCNVIE